MIGLAGSHRTGKSTLARAYAEKHDALFVETSASAVFRDMGLDPAVTYSFATRLEVQKEILRRMDAAYAAVPAGKEAITDRTPVDMLAYTMAEAVGDRVEEKDQADFKRYAEDCIAVTNKRFSVLVIVQPGIKIVAADGKAALNEAYMEHLNSLMLGLSVDERIKCQHYYLQRSNLDLENRLKGLEAVIKKTYQSGFAKYEPVYGGSDLRH